MDGAVLDIQEKLKEIEGERKKLSQQERNYQKEVRQLSALKGEVDGILRIHKRYEGLSGSVKALLEHPLAKGVLAEYLRISEARTQWAAVALYTAYRGITI